jgi:hypothetical protein
MILEKPFAFDALVLRKVVQFRGLSLIEAASKMLPPLFSAGLQG